MNFSIIIYSVICITLMFISSKISPKLKLVDKPNKRKIHSIPVSYTGGITISIILVISIFIFNISNNSLNLILSISFLISVVGLIDDKYHLNVGGKLSLQIITILYLVLFEKFYLLDLGNYDLFRLNLGSFSIPFTFMSIIFLINAFNYFDGMDGTLSISLFSVLFILYFLTDKTDFHFFLLIITLPILFFLFFNLSVFNLPKMFLGDSGSLLIGFIISFILIYLAKNNLVHPILLAWSVVIFVYEFLSINLIRIFKNKNPFKPSQDHLHHVLYKKIQSINISNFIIFSANIILFIIGYLSFLFVNPITSLALFICLFIVFLFMRYKFLYDSSFFKL